jgi:hypothetical protein
MAQGQFSGIQTEGVSDDQVDVLMAQGQFSGIQTEEVSSSPLVSINVEFFPIIR